MATDIDNSERDGWDWITVVVIALGIVVLMVLTFEFWIPHPFTGYR